MHEIRFGCSFALLGVALPLVAAGLLIDFIPSTFWGPLIGVLVAGIGFWFGSFAAGRWTKLNWNLDPFDAFRSDRRPDFTRTRFLATLATLRITGLVFIIVAVLSTLISLFK